MRYRNLLVLLAILVLGLGIRFVSAYPANTTVGFDQARDFFDSVSIISNHDLRIIGPQAGNNPNLHHGIAYLYYILPPLVLSGGNPIWAVLWNSIFNVGAAGILYFLNKSIFKSTTAGIFAALIAAFSFQFVQYSGWLSNPTVTIFTVPLFFLGLWEYYERKNWGLLIASLALGLSIEFELFFLYLIPAALIFWVFFKPKVPTVKLGLITLAVFFLSTLTMILTEIKFHFAGAVSLLGAGSYVGLGKAPFDKILSAFLQKFWNTFSLNLWPQKQEFGILLGILIICFLLFILLDKQINSFTKKGVCFLLLYLFSPALMLLLGYHNAPWFLIGLPPAIALSTGFVLSKLKYRWLGLSLITLTIWANLAATAASQGKGQILLEPDRSALLSKQLAVIDYTYLESLGQAFYINTLTNPLYINAIWAYNYQWYGKTKYQYLPSFSGGNQISPYNTLPKANGKAAYLYLIIDQTPRIPDIYRLNLVNWADKNSQLLEEEDFDGILVQKRQLK